MELANPGSAVRLTSVDICVTNCATWLGMLSNVYPSKDYMCILPKSILGKLAICPDISLFLVDFVLILSYTVIVAYQMSIKWTFTTV